MSRCSASVGSGGLVSRCSASVGSGGLVSRCSVSVGRFVGWAGRVYIECYDVTCCSNIPGM